MKRLGVLHLADSRSDFYKKREALVLEEIERIGWIFKEYDILNSSIVNSEKDLEKAIDIFLASGVKAMIVHLPIWADPIFTVKAATRIDGPILLLGNSREETSSMVAMLGSGGALGQIGKKHMRVFDHASADGIGAIRSFIAAVDAIENIKGKTLGTFGSMGLGIFTTVADPAQVMKIFGINIHYYDENLIIKNAEQVSDGEAEKICKWFSDHVQSVTFGGIFTEEAFLKQAKSYMATDSLAREHDLDILCVKCQQALSDGYTTQCMSHMLMNSTLDHEGTKAPVVHSCESDIDGAITMNILQELSKGQATSLLDIRSIKPDIGKMAFANCGSTAIDMFSAENKGSTNGMGKIDIMPHVFGEAGGCAFSGVFSPGNITLARLTRLNGVYRMDVIEGDIEEPLNDELAHVTKEFPKALVQARVTKEFLESFGSNHMHGVRGHFAKEIKTFCELIGIECKVWR